MKKEIIQKNVQLGLLITSVDTLMSLLAYKKIINKEELQTMIDKSLEKKTAELRDGNDWKSPTGCRR